MTSPPPTATAPVYQTHSWQPTLRAAIISCDPVSALTDSDRALAPAQLPPSASALVTDRTIFYAKGGGQPSDAGVMLPSTPSPTIVPYHLPSADGAFSVAAVRKAPGGRILHFGSFGAAPFAPGQQVTQALDCALRVRHSRLHSAGHVLGLAVHMLAPTLGPLKEIKANHAPGEAALELEGRVAGEHKALIQKTVDEIVAADWEIRIHYWSEDECRAKGGIEAEAPEGEAVVRVCEIEGRDYSPCGGTHVPRTGLTGPITVKKISRQKGTTRISYDVGEAELADFEWAGEM